MLRITSICLLHVMALSASSQLADYAKWRPSVMVMNCGVVDTTTLNTSIRNLLALDTNLLTKNMNMYYEDLGLCYWVKSGGNVESEYLQLSIVTTQKALHHNPTSTKAFWSLAFGYTFAGNCERGKYYMEKYKQFTKKKYWDLEQEQQLFANCSI